MPSAPRLNVSHLRRGASWAERADTASPAAIAARSESSSISSASEVDSSASSAAESLARVQAHMMQALRAMVSQSENVGSRFAEEARRIHYGEAEPRSIRGQASRADTEALVEEGIAVLPLPDVPGLKEPLQ